MAFLINKHLPAYTYHEYHEKLISASARECFLTAKNLDMSKSFITKALMQIRGLPIKNLSLPAFIKNMHFKYLEENPFKEFIIDASQPNIKITWNFYFKKVNEYKTLASTETRILCLTKKSKFWFSLYWFLIKPFSGIIRIEMLRLIKRKAENN